MRMRLRTEQRTKAARIAMAAALTVALLGTVPLAFAEEGGERFEESSSASPESAFRLGHVAIEYVDASSETEAGSDEAGESKQGSELAIGEQEERVYRITNKGETSYIRIASHMVLGELQHNNDLAVTEARAAETSEADEALSPEPLWRFAADGYWYRSVPLDVDEIIEIRVSVGIPFEENWIAALDKGAAARVIETFDVQALQARNKAIDLTSSNPWGEDGMESPLESEAFLPEGEGSER